MQESIEVASVKDFGAVVRAERKRLGYTQVDFAEACNVSTSYLSMLENGKDTAEFGKAIRIATMLGIDLCMRKR